MPTNATLHWSGTTSLTDLTDHIYMTRLVSMSRASISELKANLSKYLREVRRGGEVQILDRGTPVAWLKPAVELGIDANQEEALRTKLIRDGVLTPGTESARKILDEPPIRLPTSILDALIEDRDDRL